MQEMDYQPATEANEQEIASHNFFGFDSEEKAKPIGIDLLRRSVRVEGKFGKQLPTRPVQFWDVHQHIENDLRELNINFTPDPIFVQAKNSYLLLPDKEKGMYRKDSAPIDRWQFDKLVGRLHIPNVIGDNSVNAAIAMAYNEDGIQISFGLNVRVCQNMNIMGGNILRTFKVGDIERNSYDGMLAVVNRWLRNLEQYAQVEYEIMKELQEAEVDAHSIDTMIGMMYRAAINQAYGTKELAPLNTEGMSLFTQGLIKRKETPIQTAWDLYNVGTEIMKPGQMDIQNIHTASFLLCKFIMDQMGLTKFK